EIFICPEIAKEQSKVYGTKLKDELTLLLVHGLLHLIGYKDRKTDEKKGMRRMERKLVKELKACL
ncbi:rRNA maturation RNase YbeY, partial [bacterium]